MGRGRRLRLPPIIARGIQNVVDRVLHLERSHRREVIIATVFAILCALATEPVRGWWTEHRLDEATRRILDATAILVARDRNNQPTAVGVGIFISPDGTLITNRHVVTNGGLEARLTTGAFYELRSQAGAIRSYSDYDFTILQFRGTGIPFVRLGTSGAIKARQQVLVLFPQPTFVPTFTSGFVSEPDRPIGPPLNSLIQITAPVTQTIPNGGLFDEDGRVLGFVSSAVVPPDLRKEISTLFAIPIDRLKPVINGREKQARADSADSLYSQGVLAENLKNYDQAMRYFREAIAIDPHYPNAYFQLGGIAYESGDYDGQLAMYQKAAQYAPEDAEILYYLATAYEEKGLYDQAIEEYEQVLRVKPDHKNALYQLGILYMTRGDKSRASAYAARLEQLEPASGAELRMILSRMH